MSADLLRRAAALMRERAEKATPGPWGDPADVHIGDFGWSVAGCPAGETEDSFRGKADAEHIASWHPAVALAVADWLDEAAQGAEGFPRQTGEPFRLALVVARAYLGEDAP